MSSNYNKFFDTSIINKLINKQNQSTPVYITGNRIAWICIGVAILYLWFRYDQKQQRSRENNYLNPYGGIPHGV